MCLDDDGHLPHAANLANAPARRPVGIQIEVGIALQELLHHRNTFGMCQESAQAMMHSFAECQVPVRRTADDELVRLRELPRIAVANGIYQARDIAGLHCDIANPHGVSDEPENAGWRIEAQELIDRGRDDRGIAGKMAPQIRVPGQAVQGVRQ